MARIKEFDFDGVSIKLQRSGGKTLKDVLSNNKISYIQLKKPEQITYELDMEVKCETYKYTNPTTGIVWYVYEYTKNDWADGLERYIALTESEQELNTCKLYNAIMIEIKDYITCDGISFYFELVSDKVFQEDYLEKEGIPYTMIKEDELVAFGFGVMVHCDVYKYTSKKSGAAWYVYEYIENNGPDGLGSYIAATKSKEEVNIVKLYDTIMAQFSTV